MIALRNVWVWYLSVVLVLVAGAAVGDPPGRWPAALLLHGAGLVLALLLPVRADRRSRVAWGGFTLIGLPTVFSAVGLVLPELHGQPYEFTWIAADRAICGGDPTVAVQVLAAPWLVGVLQWSYASFYFLPVAVLLALAAGGRSADFDRGLLLVAFGFLLSYLGYYLFPTLPPYRYLDHGPPLQGWLWATEVHALLDRLEANRFDCFPSGHTMMTLATLGFARRRTPRLFAVLAPIGALLIAATVVLRYHYLVDVLAGAALAPLPRLLTRRMLPERHITM